VPTIDEFGGYCKFDGPAKQPISTVVEVDWNEKIRLLDLECEREEKNLLHTRPESRVIKRIKTEEFGKVKKPQMKIAVPEQLLVADDDSLCTPPKQVKRQRYGSDSTTATRPAHKMSEASNLKVNPYLNDDLQNDFDIEKYENDSFFNFGFNSFKIEHPKVSLHTACRSNF